MSATIDTQTTRNDGSILEKTMTSLKIKAMKTGKLFLTLLLFLSFFVASEMTRLIYNTFNNPTQINTAGPMNNSTPENMSQGLAGDASFIQFLTPEDVNTKFTDVGGMHEVKEEIKEVVDFLKAPEKFEDMGAKIPKGVLLIGAPGTGKTLMARAVAGEANVSFLSVSGSTFQNGWIGTGAARVRILFEEARKRAPAIIFVDEIESLLPRRVYNGMGGDQEYAATVNQFLAEMDGIDKQKNQGIVVIGATNNVGVMDQAALRPGRFDRHVIVSPPTFIEREEILQLNFKKIPIIKTLNVKSIAKGTVGFSGADLKNLVNEAAIYATRAKKKAVDSESIEYAKDKILLGRKRPALVLNDKEKKIVAYHEAGHALVGLILKNDPVTKISITPRGHSLGVTVFAPEDDYHLMNKNYMEGKIAEALGGCSAEAIIFGDNNVTNGSESDLKKATEIANHMVTKWGFSKLGLVYHLDSFSQDEVLTEVKDIIERNRKRVREILQTNIDKLHALANALLEKESLEPAEIKKIMAGSK